MAVLKLPGADAVLAAQATALPQPDQLCGPFSAFVALHAVLDSTEVPPLVTIATASGTAIWPRDVAAWRPREAPADRTGWEVLPAAPDPGSSGTDAAGLARGIALTTGSSVEVIPVAGGSADGATLTSLVEALARSETPVGVIANVRTGVLDPTAGWDVGHFVVIWAIEVDRSDGPAIAVADTYRELGDPDEPPGCRWLPVDRLVDAIAQAPGRGLLLVTPSEHAAEMTVRVRAAGLDPTIWST